jgi:hypothetical protein
MTGPRQSRKVVVVVVAVAVAGVIFLGPPFGSFGTYPPTTTPARYARALDGHGDDDVYDDLSSL